MISRGRGCSPLESRHCWVVSPPSAKLLTGRIHPVPSVLIQAREGGAIFRESERQMRSTLGKTDPFVRDERSGGQATASASLRPLDGGDSGRAYLRYIADRPPVRRWLALEGR